MNRALDQIARLSASLSPGSRVRVVIDIDPDGSVKFDTQASAHLTDRRTTVAKRAQANRVRVASVIDWLEAELSQRPAPDFSHYLLDSAEASRRMARAGLPPLRGKAINAMLKAAGYVKLGLMWGPDGTANYWSVYPEKFRDHNGTLLTDKVREYLTPL